MKHNSENVDSEGLNNYVQDLRKVKLDKILTRKGRGRHAFPLLPGEIWEVRYF